MSNRFGDEIMKQPNTSHRPVPSGPSVARAIRRIHVLRATLITLSTAFAAGGAGAATLVSATTGSTTNSAPSGSVAAAEPTPFGSHSSSASLGVLQATSSVVFPGMGSDSGLTPLASFTDDFTITAPGATTIPGTMTVLVRVEGGPSFTESRSSAAVSQGMNVGYQALSLRAGGSLNLVNGTIIYNTGSPMEVTPLGTVPAPGLISVDFNFSFGFPIELGFSLDARAGGSNSFSSPEDGTLSGTTDVTLIWEGITSIRDQAGTELLDEATVTSGSGMDWTVSQAPPPVPLGSIVAPASGLLLIAFGVARARRER